MLRVFTIDTKCFATNEARHTCALQAEEGQLNNSEYPSGRNLSHVEL